ncbi:MAG TPA: hypothetical protein VNH44_13320 [Micropepsaceae bacterium]|nr:hypothetical protein [Micropepsaceae bacterium]
MREWDPIGVQDIPEAADEYDGYVGRVHVMLMSEQASAETIAAYLFDIATNHMGLSNSVRLAELSDHAASTLVAIRPELEIH